MTEMELTALALRNELINPWNEGHDLPRKVDADLRLLIAEVRRLRAGIRAELAFYEDTIYTPPAALLRLSAILAKASVKKRTK